MTIFQKRVYDATSQIPKGRVTSYGKLAHQLGIHSAQAIGQALKHNPHAPKIPYHRVICSNGFIGGYLGTLDSKKRTLLKEEEVYFDETGFLVNKDCWWE